MHPDDPLSLLLHLGRSLRDTVVEQCERRSTQALAAIAEDGPGDTIYAVDKVSEAALTRELAAHAQGIGGIVLVAEGLTDGYRVIPGGPPESAAHRLIVDPIDGTRGLMYQKRSAWVLLGLAPNRGEGTCLRDIDLAVQIEIPLLKQHLCDELWAQKGKGAHAERLNRLTGQRTRLPLRPSQSPTIAHGYAMLSRFFPGARDVLAAIDEEVMLEVLGPAPSGKALCFEDQYASTGGQLYELMVGHDRFQADLRPWMEPLLEERGLPTGLCCHPYDLATWLIAAEAGVILTDPGGGPLDAPLDLDAKIAWVGYANRKLKESVEPALHRALSRRGLLERSP